MKKKSSFTLLFIASSNVNFQFKFKSQNTQISHILRLMSLHCDSNIEIEKNNNNTYQMRDTMQFLSFTNQVTTTVIKFGSSDKN